MSGNKLLLDTNIVLYVLSGDTTLAGFLVDKELFISVITELELLSYHLLSSKESVAVKEFVNEMNVIPISENVKHLTIQIRRSTKMRLPDSIIAASAMDQNISLITADKQFSKLKELDIILYEK